MQTDRLKPFILLPVVASGVLIVFPPSSWMYGSQVFRRSFSQHTRMQDMLSNSGSQAGGQSGAWRSVPQTRKPLRILKVKEGTTIIVPQAARLGGWLIFFPGGGSTSGFYGVSQQGWNVGPSGTNASILSVPHGIAAATGFRLLFEYPASEDSARVGVQFDVVNSSVARLPQQDKREGSISL